MCTFRVSVYRKYRIGTESRTDTDGRIGTPIRVPIKQSKVAFEAIFVSLSKRRTQIVHRRSYSGVRGPSDADMAGMVR